VRAVLLFVQVFPATWPGLLFQLLELAEPCLGGKQVRASHASQSTFSYDLRAESMLISAARAFISSSPALDCWSICCGAGFQFLAGFGDFLGLAGVIGLHQHAVLEAFRPLDLLPVPVEFL
jgi:hypothetical protein